MTAALEAEFSDVFEGRPDELGARADRLSATAEAILAAADALRDLVDEQRSLATDAVGETADESTAKMRRAGRRYERTAQALTTYAVELAPIQAAARSAIADAEHQQSRQYMLQAHLADIEIDIVQAEARGVSTAALESDRWDAYAGLSSAAAGLEDARRTLYDAREQIRDAADRAISAIEVAIEDGKDSFGDNWDQFWGGVRDFFSPVAEWAQRALKVVTTVLMDRISAAVSALVVAVLMLVGALVIGFIVTTLGTAGLIVVAAILAAALLALVITESLGKPVKVGGTHVTTEGADTDVNKAEARDYQGIMQDLAEQDLNGLFVKTEIRVVAIRDAAGEVISWRIQLPSTQAWSPTNTDGALNDARTDAMLALFPGVPTQYESAVWDAMTDAGVFESEAPIMFTGWSLGGMMAGELATDARVADRVESVFTAGAAIDKHYSDIPQGVRVTQINNGIDPVHTLEFSGLGAEDYVRTGGTWQTYRPLAWPIHEATMYGTEAERFLPEPRAGDEIFFAAEGSASYEDVYVAEYTRGS
ncbi:hypothetical protein [Microbacterium sp. C7(2022)]|uniref:hypothetical protein n=1 Tax=Microbacterium sp. C7(2022) TaxID=2992759 RepID=UPI00237AE31B|nr:hypothetical protein [Microbacterium sp. C7(2022)]MDE0545139.1 hypothetical protein [Microbacterium sp. C7(2022)]